MYQLCIYIIYSYVAVYTLHRISYCMYILEQLSAMFPDHEIQLMYDVACILVKHLQVRVLKLCLATYKTSLCCSG